MDQLSAYGAVSDPLYFTTRFLDGLRDEVRAVVIMQRPGDLDAACSLALLQEEVADSGRRRAFPRFESGLWSMQLLYHSFCKRKGAEQKY